MNKQKWGKVVINLPDDEHKEVLDIAKRDLRTIGSLGRKALMDFVKKFKEKEKNE